MPRPFAICVAALLCFCGATAAFATKEKDPSTARHPPVYAITVIPYYSPEKLWTKFAPFIEHLRKATGLPWELKLYPSHASLLDGLCKGEASFAFLGPVPLARAIDRCGVEIAVVALGKDGQPFYHSVIVTADPSVQTLGDLRGRRFGLFKGSTAAHIIPLKMLHDAGLGDNDIVPVLFESQDHIMNALLEHAVAGAGVKDVLYQKFKAEHLRILKTSGPLPGFAFAVAPNVSASTKQLFMGSLLRLDPRTRPEDRRLMQEWDDEIKNGFILPPPSLRSSILNALSVYREILHED
jgi:phosphonate transport system substrate-binding protein